MMYPTAGKILFFNSHRAWGGGEKWHLDMAGMLRSEGYDVALAAFPEGEMAKRGKQNNLPVFESAIGNLSFINPLKMVKLYRLFKRRHIHTLVLNLPADLKSAGVAAKLAGVPRIIYRRGSAIPVRDTLLNRILFRYVLTDVIANSEETKRTLLANNRRLFPREKIHVIYNGIDLHAFDRKSRSAIASPDNGGVVLGHAGRLSAEKNQHFLIEVMAELRKRGVECRLKIAGTGPLESELKNYAQEKGVADVVDMMGFVDDMPCFMKSIDLFLLSSHWEGFGYVLIEAMAAAKPVVAFNSSSTPEIVVNEETGFLVEARDLNAFVACVMRLQSDNRKRSELGAAGRKRVESLFTIEAAKAAMKRVLEIPSHG